MINLPNFSNIQTDHIIVQLNHRLNQNRETYKALLSQQGTYTWENLIEPIESLEDALSKLWSPISHLNAVANTPELRAVYQEGITLLSDYHTELGHNQALYQAVQSIKASDSFSDLSIAQQTTIEHMLRDFRLAGVALPPADKEVFAQLSKSLSQLTTQFENNVLDATHGWHHLIQDPALLKGLPEDAIASAKACAESNEQSGWRLTLDIPCYLAVMTYADSRELRALMQEAYQTRASEIGPNGGRWDNSQVMVEILNTRQKMAHLLGFEHHAGRSLATKMVQQPEEVLAFLEELVTSAKPMAIHELESLQVFAQSNCGIDELAPWDLAYVSEKKRQAEYDISETQLREYFPLETVLSGLFDIVNKLFNITVRPISTADTWHPDVRVYDILNESGETISAFYLDMHARQDKRGGAWMDECQVRRMTQNGIQYPIAYITCNTQAPVGNQPALLFHDDVVTLFHEFGHGLQHMLTQVDVASVSGINGIPWDAVEVASQFLENFAWEADTLAMISSHIDTGEPIPAPLIEKMHRAKHFHAALQMLRQCEFALFDFECHMYQDTYDENTVASVLDSVREHVSVLPIPSYNRFQHSFSHIFAGGYAAGYYSYKWAEVMAADAFSLFKERGIFDKKTSQHFLNTLLASGGAVDPMTLFIDFRGRKPTINALLESTGILTAEEQQ